MFVINIWAFTLDEFSWEGVRVGNKLTVCQHLAYYAYTGLYEACVSYAKLCHRNMDTYQITRPVNYSELIKVWNCLVDTAGEKKA